ncbi:methyl-accepting chemotaxis protein [Halioxenophilus aromaticivorans]|uniref:Methyl-accepting chemotaxis protein n=1 Tax=Halioxenophilus aromaticivorans TaxID=1306992 RepID=A0AAV3UAZ3_9ALTE
MNWLSSLGIKYKILMISLVGTIGFMVYLAVIVNSGIKNNARLEQIQTVLFPFLEHAKNNIVLLDRSNELMASAASTGEADMLTLANGVIGELKSNLSEQSALKPQAASQLEGVKRNLDEFFRKSSDLTRSMIDGTVDYTQLSGLAEEKTRLNERSAEQLRAIKVSALESFNETIQRVSDDQQSNLTLGIIIGLITVSALMFFGISIALMVTKSVQRVSRSLQDIAEGEGDLTRRIRQTSNDEIGELVRWFNVFVEKLHSTIGEVVRVIPPLSEVAQDLNAVSSETAQASQHQSQNANVVSAAMDDMLGSVNNVAGNAGSAAQAANDADKEAKEGLTIVQNTVLSINDLAAEVERAAEVIVQLESDTESVGGILDVIKGIAEQTNLLALNAAIEAARAGEQGRGFAVVADEVRTLASRTQESTHEIQKVIEQLQNAAQSAVTVMSQGKEQAQKSVDQAGATGASLQAITAKVTSITDMNQQIAKATEAQQRFANDIQQNVLGMRDASRSAEQNTERVNSLSFNLQNLADQLQKVALQFRV